MARRILCKDEIEVTLNIQGERSLLFVRNDRNATRFWLNTSELEKALQGQPAEIVEVDGRCKVVVKDGESCAFYYDRHGKEQTCTFPTSDLLRALTDARGT